MSTEVDAQSFICKSIAIYRIGDDEKPFANITQLVTHFQYHEDIMKPCCAGELVVRDNKDNLISSMPIQGWEKVVVSVEKEEVQYDYEFRVWTIANRVTTDRRQAYTLGLISEAGLLNEGVRVNRIVKGETSTAVRKMLKDYLNVPEEKIFTEPSANNIKLLPTKKSPFSVIREIQIKTVSTNTTTPDTQKWKSTAKDEQITADSSGYTKSSDVDVAEATKANGTAGYLFFQNYKGFVFRSIDSLCSTGEEFSGVGPRESYTYSPGKTPYEDTTKIQEIIFTSEVNMLKKMREGAYSSLVCFFNINTGTYDEYIYSLADTWKDMIHMGSQDQLPAGQTKLSQYPTRIMSSVIDNEKWYNGVESGEEKGDFLDLQKHYLSQSHSRIGILFNHQVTISVPGQLQLVAGDKIEIFIPNQLSDEEYPDQEPWDDDSSGVYLIKNLNHQFNITGQEVFTVLDLVRDSKGVKRNAKPKE